MNDLSEFFGKLFTVDSWPARWYCGRWTPFHGWLYIISSVLIALAYFSIPLTLFYLIKKSANKLPFKKIFWLFLLFILACGFTHVFDAVMFWYPAYRVSAVVLFVTAVVSWMAVFGLIKIVPAALNLKSPAMLEKIIQERTEQLELSNESLKKTIDELHEARLDTEKLMQQKDEFLGVASHELKTPVTSLKAYNQILAAMPDVANGIDKPAMHVKMDTQINKLTLLINNLLDVTKIHEGGLMYNKEQMNLADVVEEIAGEMQRTTLTHSIVFEHTADAIINGDKERIGQVLTNLVSNAVKYSAPNSPVVIKLRQENGMAVCSIKDAGLGIPAAQQDKVFEKFYRVSGKNMHTYPGLGLGLYLVKDIIAKHNGEVWFESEEGKGSVFYFSLPLLATQING